MKHNRRPLRLIDSSPLTIAFDSPKVIKEIPAQQIKAAVIDIEYFIDSPVDRIVEAYTKQVGKIVLWAGDEYDAIGDWTVDNVKTRINEIYK